MTHQIVVHIQLCLFHIDLKYPLISQFVVSLIFSLQKKFDCRLVVACHIYAMVTNLTVVLMVPVMESLHEQVPDCRYEPIHCKHERRGSERNLTYESYYQAVPYHETI